VETTIIKLAEEAKSNEHRSRSNTKRVDEMTFALKAVENTTKDLDHTINKNGLKKAIVDMRDEFKLLREFVEKGFADLKQEFQEFYLHRGETCPVMKQQEEFDKLMKVKQDEIMKTQEECFRKRERKIRIIEIAVVILALIPVYIGLFVR